MIDGFLSQAMTFLQNSRNGSPQIRSGKAAIFPLPYTLKQASLHERVVKQTKRRVMMREKMEMDEIRTLTENLFRDIFPQVDLIEVVFKPEVDWEGDKILNITFVFDGAGRLESRKALDLGDQIWMKTVDDEDRFPMVNFINKETAKVMKIGNAA